MRTIWLWIIIGRTFLIVNCSIPAHPTRRNDQWLKSSIDQLQSSHDFRQVAIYSNESNACHDEIIGEFSKHFPTTNANSTELAKPKNKRILAQMPLIKKPTSGLLNVFLIDGTELDSNIIINETKGFITSVLEYNNVAPRPQCLLMVTLKEKNTLGQQELKELFNWVWDRKYLDFTVIEVRKYNQTLIVYDPFTDEMACQKFNDSQELIIFPSDKLSDMHGYPFKYVITSNALEVEKNTKRKDIFFMKPGRYAFFKGHFRKYLNFTLLIEDKLFNYYAEFDKFDAYHGASPIPYYAYDKVLTVSSFDDLKWIAAHPHISEKSEFELMPVVNFGILLVAMSSIFILPAWILGFSRDTWNLMNVYLCLLGYPAVYVPTPGRRTGIIFIAMVILSILIGAEYVSIITDAMFIVTEVSLESPEGLGKFNFPLFLDGILWDDVVVRNDSLLEYFPNKVNKIGWNDFDGYKECLRNLALQNDRMCVLREDAVQFLSLLIQYHYQKKIAKSSLVFVEAYTAIIFGHRSPYAEKFYQLVLQSIERGVILNFTPDDRLRYLGYNVGNPGDDFLTTTDAAVIVNLTIVLLIGIPLATVILFLEIKCHQMSQR